MCGFDGIYGKAPEPAGGPICDRCGAPATVDDVLDPGSNDPTYVGGLGESHRLSDEHSHGLDRLGRSDSMEIDSIVSQRFRITRRVGAGGMGQVFEAFDLELDERVALKTLHPELAADPVHLSRFRREVQLARKVTNAHVCRVFDLYRQSAAGRRDVLFVSMEYLNGQSLQSLIKRHGPLAIPAALDLLTQLASGLDEAHRHGIVHRDLKPANIMLVDEGAERRVVITDFGLAQRAQSDGAALTQTGVVMGSPAYMAPEQVSGREVTPAADIYALGVILFQAITGQLPFHGDSPIAVAVQKLQEDPPSPTDWVPDLDPRWHSAILKCLARDPKQRFASAGSVLAAIHGQDPSAPAIASASYSANDPSTDFGPRRPTRRLRITALTVAALLATAGFFGWLIVEGRLTSSPPATSALEPVSALALAQSRSIAVLGFKNQNRRQDADWLSTALAEMLTSELTIGGDLVAIDGETVSRARNELKLGSYESLAATSLERIHKRLGATHVVVGSFLALPSGRLRLDLRLQDTQAGKTVRAVVVEGHEEGLFELVEEAGAELRQALSLKALDDQSVEALRVVLPASPEAARLFALGLDRLRRFEAAEGRDLLQQAADLQPKSPLIRSALAQAWAAMGYDARAQEEARRAFDGAAGLAASERLAVEARYREAAREWPQAVALYRELQRLQPQHLEWGLRLSAALISNGDAAAALAAAEDLRQLEGPAGEDPRIDLASAAAHAATSEFQAQRDLARRAAEQAERRDAPSLAAAASLALCDAHVNLGELDLAQEACETALASFESNGERRGAARAGNALGAVDFRRGRIDDAAKNFRKALGVYREIGDRASEAVALNRLAATALASQDLERAATLYGEALEKYREVADRAGEAKALNNLGIVLRDRGLLEEATQLFAQSLEIKRELGNKQGVGYTLHNLGELAATRGAVDEATVALGEAVVIFEEIGDRAALATTHLSLARVYRQAARPEAAQEALSTARALATELGNAKLLADIEAEAQIADGEP